MSAETILELSVEQLAQRLRSKESFILLDVREAWELEHALIQDDRLRVVPMSRLAKMGLRALPDEMDDKTMEILVMCHHGARSLSATGWLREQGWSKAYSVRGGIAAYADRVDRSVGRY